MTRNWSFVGIAAAVMLCGGLSPASAQQPQKPNIILILSDDLATATQAHTGEAPAEERRLPISNGSQMRA